MSIIFNGTSNYAWGRFATQMLNTANAFTIYAMFKTPATFAVSTIYSTNINTNGANDSGRGYSLTISASGAIRASSSTSGGIVNTAYLGALLPSTTYRTVLVKNAGSPNVTLYLTNIGTSVTGTGMSESNANLQGLILGKAANANSSYYTGEIEDIAVWRSALSANDIGTIFNTRRHPNDASVAPDDYWPLVSTDNASSAGTYAIVRTGSAIASTTLVTTAALAPSTKVLGSSDLTPYNLSANLGSAGEHVLPSFTASSDATIYRLGIDITSFYSTNAIRLSLRNANGDLLTTGIIGIAGIGSITVEVPSVAIVSGQKYYITVCFNSGLQITIPAYSPGYNVYRNSSSTYAAPLSNFTITGMMINNNFYVPHVWAEGSSANSDTTPNVLSFTPAVNVEKNTLTTSTAVAIAGVTDGVDLPISIANGEYSINSGAWRTTSYVTKLADTVTLRRNSSTSYNTAATTTVTISSVDSVYSITTRQADITPTQFTFTDYSMAQPSEVVISNAITISGIDSDVTSPISITNGEYAISTDAGTTWGAYTATTGVVSLSNLVRVRGTASATLSGVVNITLTVDSTADIFTITTVASITPAINVLSSTAVTDDITGFTVTTYNLPTASGITIDGRTAPSFTGSNNSYGFNAFTLSNGSTHPRYGTNRILDIGGGTTTVTVNPKASQSYITLTSVTSTAPFIGSYVTTAIGDQIVFDLSSTLSTTTNMVEATGRIVSTYTGTQSFWHISASTGLVTQISIVAPDCTPTAPVFTAQTELTPSTVVESNVVTITGATAGQVLDISVTNGEYSINSGAYTASPGTIVNGNTVKVRRTTPVSYSSSNTVTLLINTISSVFSLTTLTPDITINSLGLIDATELEINTVVESNIVTVAGVTPNYDVPVTITGGSYSVSSDNGTTWGGYITTPSNVRLGYKLKLRGTSSEWYSLSKVVILQIGTTSEVFTYTTRAAPSVTLGTEFVALDGSVNTLTAANLINADTLTIDNFTVTTLTGGGNTYQFTLPVLADGIFYPLFGTRLLRLSKGIIFTNTYVQLIPASTRIYTTLTSVNTSTGYLGNYLTCAIGDQIVFDKPATLGVSVNSIGIDGRISTDYLNTQTLYHIRATDGLVTRITLASSTTVITINLGAMYRQEETPLFDSAYYAADRP